MRCCGLYLFAIAILLSPAVAAVHEAHIPLRNHRLETAELTSALLVKMHLPGIGIGAGSIDLSGLQGGDFIAAMNAALADGGSIDLKDEELLLRVDPQKLPKNLDAIRHAVRVFMSVAAPDATANQRRTYGLFMPPQVDPHTPMVVLVHGLDCNRSNWYALAELLAQSGRQVAYFSYPSDGPVEESAAMLAEHMRAVRETFPELPLDIIAHSMGGLVARRYVEGDAYAGGVGHLIMLGTPNLGSRWAAYRVALEFEEHYQLWRHEPDWSASWMITDGLGEAGRDLRPTSAFLTQLNSRPRRAGVRYTVVAGAQHPAAPFTARALDGTANALPQRVATWWGFRQTEAALHNAAEKLRHRTGTTDGPVSVASTTLNGVDDQVILPADHNALYLSRDGNAPAAWETIKDRLNQ